MVKNVLWKEKIMFELFDSYVGRMFGYSLIIIGAGILVFIGIFLGIRHLLNR